MASLLPLLSAFAALTMVVMLSMLLAVVTGLAGLGVERAVVDSELGAELLSGTGSLAAASTWQH